MPNPVRPKLLVVIHHDGEDWWAHALLGQGIYMVVADTLDELRTAIRVDFHMLFRDRWGGVVERHWSEGRDCHPVEEHSFESMFQEVPSEPCS